MLYKLGQEASSFYVMLSGKVKLVNGGLKRLCQTGETVLEEVLFLERDRKIGLEKCKVVGETCLL